MADQEPVTLDVAAILEVAQTPWISRADMQSALVEAVGGFVADRPRFAEGFAPNDPWFWSITGRFGAPRQDLTAPGGLVICTRYGLDTLAELSESADIQRSFRLLQATQAAADDADRWPDIAVARLTCTLTWDDTRRVGILPQAVVLQGLGGAFATVDISGDLEAGGGQTAPLYGTDGYRILAQDGPETSASWVEHMLIELRVTHQRIRVRTYLYGGGM